MELSNEEKLKQANSKLMGLLMERWEHYQKWQDFNARGCPTRENMKALNDRQSAINRHHTQVDKIKKDLGYSDTQIKHENLRKVTNPHDNPRCKILLAA